MFYLHIPFCKQACHYCDFHFSTQLGDKAQMINALLREIELRSDYLVDRHIRSVYFGGGTPSLLEASDIQRILDKISENFTLDSQAEITLEANPDDLSLSKIQELRATPINRFSIGIQSFFEEDLRWMNRAHNAKEADVVIKRVQDAGFDNITCDLIYGYPLLTDEKWHRNIAQLIDYGIPHISSYAMTVEERTALHHQIKKGKTRPIDEGQSADQMAILIDQLTSNGFEHYEISNFAKDGRYAQHNTNYWNGTHYLGIGPSAHSFNGISRSWNKSNNALYMHGISNDLPVLESEILSKEDRINEYIMTSLRTMWGIRLHVVEEQFGVEVMHAMLQQAQPYILGGQLILEQYTLKLSANGKQLADRIASELFIITED
ncbi:radical SAM family heme chaperone HemW [Sphingobacterium sp. lm-10]|uniref:radical SAM family heme chaperone HemW n=1 Tax=Sphingobacterium sp. lm-10 TaxID=2944904 RepID=UPI002020F4A3|nr:radical SAM family heme chaperone HemW [Sphingobacterium sp. lm-10]MCL7988329.1 radical SAM family heme chaperone HemW [Sphingobacterium sp. lm-10]